MADAIFADAVFADTVSKLSRFLERQFRSTLQRQMQIQFLAQANQNYMVDAEVHHCR